MVMNLPDPITENSLDDIQSVDLDIDSLYERFILPIERIRSMSAPVIMESSMGKDDGGNVIRRDMDMAAVDNNSAQESRAHAFYRLLGLPVLDQDGNFYNPGFNPKRTSNAKTQINSITGRISQTFRLMARLRETSARDRLAIFQRGGQAASIYALVLPLIKKFQVINETKAITDQDDQKFTIQRRKTFISSNFVDSVGNDLTQFFESGSHILRPFVVDPTIERTVMPATRLVCEPFLESLLDTRIEADVFLQRPTIEYILRLRLRQNEQQAEILNETIFALDPVQNTINVSLPDLRRIASALLADNEIADSDLLDKIGTTNLELVTINNLIKTIKACVDLLVDAVEKISYISKDIDWTPLPVILGPEFGSDIANFIVKNDNNSDLERRIKQLTLKSQNSVRQPTATSQSIGSFALSSFDNTEKIFSDELADAKEQRLNLIRQGSNALRTIEIMTGEISGLGLIDILSVYIALWAIDLDVLISLLDVSAFQRLYDFNSDLINSNVTTRNQGGPVFGGQPALQELEKQIINILAFSDRLVEQRLASPKISEGGSI